MTLRLRALVFEGGHPSAGTVAYTFEHPEGNFATENEINEYLDKLVDDGYHNALEDIKAGVAGRMAHY